MTHAERVDALVENVLQGGLSRRSVLRRAAALGSSVPALSALVAARPGGALAAGELNLASNQSDPEPKKFMEQTVVPDFEAKSGIKVSLNTVAHEDFKTAIRTYLASDNPPDVLTWFAGNRMRFFVDKGLVMPVDDVYQKEGWTTAYPEGILAVAKGKDGKFYFVPNNYYWWAVYYRPSLFQKAGIESLPTTWAEFLAVVDKLSAAEITPITIGTQAPWPAAGWFDFLNMRVNGPEFHIKMTDGLVAYNSPEVKETFAHWKQLLDKKAFIPNPTSLKWEDALTPMTRGKAAMYLIGGFVNDSWPKQPAELVKDLDFFQFPKINDVPVGIDAPTDAFFASAKAKHVDEAKQFLAYVGGKDSQELGVKLLPGRIAVNKNVPISLYNAATQKGVKLIQSANYVAQFYDRDTKPEMADTGMNAFVQFMENPGDVNAILDNLDEERKRIFSSDQ